MITRSDIISKASMDCLKELYSKVQPSVDWDDFVQLNKDYSKKYKEWEEKRRNGEVISPKEFCGPRPFEFYYLPKEVMKDIIDSYVYAYKIDVHQDLLDIIEILKGYCRETITDKWIEGENGFPGYRGYDRPDNLEKEIQKLIQEYDSSDVSKEISEKCCNKFFEFLDMAGKFYSWNSDLNAFNTTVYLGPSPSSNKERVIENWKKYKNEDITIDDSIYEEDY